MALMDKIKAVIEPVKHGWNLLVMIVYIGLCMILFSVTTSGFIEIIKTFETSEQGTNTFIAFIVLSLTLAILSYTATSSENKNKDLFLKVGKNFSISAILFFIGFVAFKGINSELFKQSENWLRIVVLLATAGALFYSIIGFVISLFMLLTIQTGLWNKFEQDMKNAKEWFIRSKYKRLIVIIGFVLYILILLLVRYKDIFIR